MILWHRYRLVWLILLGGVGFAMPYIPVRSAQAAEQIYVSYLFLERSIAVRDLALFAQDGRMTRNLASYARYLTPEQLEELRQGLQERVQIDPVTISQFLYTPIGELLLKRAEQVVQTKSGAGSFHALRAALILAAANPDGLTALTFLQNYPGQGIKIDLTEALRILTEVRQLVAQTNAMVAQIQAQVDTEPVPADRLAVQALQLSGSYSWQKVVLNLQDARPQRLAYTGQPRKVLTDIYLPITAPSQPRPIIVISHGLNSDRNSYAYLAEHLVSHGFVVVVPEHLGSNTQQLLALLQGRAKEVTDPTEFLDRPLDVSFILDQLEQRAQSDPIFQGRLNFEQVGIVGQSFGGYTALVLAGAPLNLGQLRQDCDTQLDQTFNLSLLLQCQALRLPAQPYALTDPRIRAVVAINPIGSSLLGPESYRQIQVPVMVIAGSADTVAPAVQEQFQPFSWLTQTHKYLLLILNGTHFSTIAPSQTESGVLPDLSDLVGPAPGLARHYLKATSLAFFNTHVADSSQASALLTPKLAATLSQDPLPLSLTQTLQLPNARFLELK